MLSEISHFSLAIDIEIFLSLFNMLQNEKMWPFKGSCSDSHQGHYAIAQLSNLGMFQYTMHADSEYTKLVMEVQYAVFFCFGVRWGNKFVFTQIISWY